MAKRFSDQWYREKKEDAWEDVRDAVGDTEDYTSELEDVDIEEIEDPLRMESGPKKRIYTNTALDRILSTKGGIEAGRSIELFGAFAAGKTQVINALLAEAEGLVIFIDSEHTFSADRFKELCEAREKDVEDVRKRFKLYQPENWVEQEAVVRKLPEFDSEGELIEVGIVAVDSLMKTWAEAREFYGRQNMTNRQQLVRAQLSDLQNYCRRHKAVMVFSNQVYDIPVNKQYAPPEDKIGSRGGKTVEHMGDYRIFLRKGPKNIRFARLVDAPDLPLTEVPFILDVSGIKDIPEPGERVRAMEVGNRYGEKFLSGKLYSRGPAKKYYEKALELGYITPEEASEWLKEDVIQKIEADREAKVEGGKSMDDIEESIKDELPSKSEDDDDF